MKIIKAPYIDQTEKWVYGCESVSTVMLLQYIGVDIDPDKFIDGHLPRGYSSMKNGVMQAPDPMYFYINEPRNLTGWGCYAPSIINGIKSVFKEYKIQKYIPVDESGKTAKELCCEYIDNDMPVIFWGTLDFMPIPDKERTKWILPNGDEYTWINGEHCLLLVGYDEKNYYFNDPWHNHGCCPYEKEVVERRHMDQKMQAVGLKVN